MTRKITDQLTYVTIERNGVAHTYHKTPSPNTRLSTGWTPSLSTAPAKRISYASYVRLHTLMMQQFVSIQGRTMTCYYISRSVKPEPVSVAAPAVEPQTAAYQAAVDTIADRIERFANWQLNRWNFVAGDQRFSRWDYERELNEQIDMALGR